jgi:PAS domain S-box-containing protein
VIAATAYIAIFVFLVWTIGRSVIKLDAERKRLEQSLLQSEKEFKELFEDAPVAYHELDNAGRIIRVNQTELQLFGYDAVEMRGHFVWEFLDDEEASRQSVLAKLAGTKPPAKSVERLYRRKDLTTIAVVSVDVVLRDADGRIAGIRTTLQDVSELVRTQKLLHESEERFKQVAESAEEWIWETDAQGLYTYSSSAVQTILGYFPEEIVGKKHFYDLFASDVRDAFRQAALAAFARKEAIRGLINPNLHKNGSVVIMETSGLPVLDQRGNLLAYRGTDTDITGRVRAEESLRQSVSLLEATLESTADGILVVDQSGKITSYNKQFAEMWNMPDDIVASRNDARALNHVLEQLKDPEAFLSKVRDLYAHPDESSFDVLEFKDGKIFERCSQPQRVDGKPTGRVWSFRNVTERKLADQERESLINELKTALENVRTLSGLIPICAHCKKIRDDKGYWNQLEKYLVERTDVKLTHGICPDCAKLYYPGYTEKASPG